MAVAKKAVRAGTRKSSTIVARATRKREIPPYSVVKTELDAATRRTKRALGVKPKISNG